MAEEPTPNDQDAAPVGALGQRGPAVPRICCAVCSRPIDTVLKPLCDECFAKFYGGEL